MLTQLLHAATTTQRTPQAAWALGLLNVALLPWFAAAVWFAEDSGFWIHASIAYEGVTLGVLGGVRMGFDFAKLDRLPRYHDCAIAISLPLIGFAALLPAPLAGAAMLMAGFLISSFWDILAAHAGSVPRWYGRMRLRFLPAMLLFLAAVMAKLLVDSG